MLPAPKRYSSLLNSCRQFLSGGSILLGTKQGRYKLAAILDFILIVFILIYGRQPAQRMISPLLSSVNTFYANQVKTTKEVFVFVPGLAQNKFDSVDFNGLNVLSFFDVPLTEEGQMNTDSRGYASFKSDESQQLFNQAHSQGTKVFVTLTLSEDDQVKNLLDKRVAQQSLFDQVLSEIKDSNIDGVTVDFEPNNLSSYKHQFSQFIADFTTRLHADNPQFKLAVAVPNSALTKADMFDVSALAKGADKVFLLADNFIVPETKNAQPSRPTFGYAEADWWRDLASNIIKFINEVPENKLAAERAWYGSGDNYPLYVPSSQPSSENVLTSDPSKVSLDGDSVDRLVAGVPKKGQEAARKNIPIIAKALKDEGILDSNVLAYAMATVEHETDETFAPIDEIQGRKSARRLGYEGGENFFGRGFIQITHLRNYRQIGERIGMGDKLARNPELASQPEVAAKILAAFFKDNNVANLASQGDFVAARNPINPDYNGWSVARLAIKYELE